MFALCINVECIILVSKASDYKYCYLSKFFTWVEDTTFYPVDDMDVKVEVAVEGACESLVGRSTCAKCLERLDQSTIVRLVGAIDWKEILTIDLEPIVRAESLIFGHPYILSCVYSFSRMRGCTPSPQVRGGP